MRANFSKQDDVQEKEMNYITNTGVLQVRCIQQQTTRHRKMDEDSY